MIGSGQADRQPRRADAGQLQLWVALSVDALELVLHVEEPDARGAGEHDKSWTPRMALLNLRLLTS
jgi:hypothetical protein